MAAPSHGAGGAAGAEEVFPPILGHHPVDADGFRKLDLERVPRVLVFNKADKLDPGVVAHMAEVRGAAHSAATSAAGVQPVIERLERELQALEDARAAV